MTARRISATLQSLCLCCILTSTGLGAHGDPAGAFGVIQDAYPRRAYVGGGFSAFFGALALNRGWQMSQDPRLPHQERSAGVALGVLGAIRLADGVQRLIWEPRSMEHARLFGQGRLPDPVRQLFANASRSRSIRLWRAHLVLLTGLAYFYLGQTGKETYDGLAETGVFLFALAGFQYYRESPEEEALRTFTASERATMTWLVAPTRAGVRLGVRIGF